MISIRLPDDIIKKIKKYANENSITQQEAYRKIINTGLDYLNNKNDKSEKLNEIVARNSIESKYYMQQIYRNLFDNNTSKYNNPDDEFADIKQQAIDVISQLKDDSKK